MTCVWEGNEWGIRGRREKEVMEGRGSKGKERKGKRKREICV